MDSSNFWIANYRLCKCVERNYSTTIQNIERSKIVYAMRLL